jgi:hypothetical protein
MQPMPPLIMNKIIATIMTKQSSGTIQPKAGNGISRHHSHGKDCGVAGSAANTADALAS